MVRFKVLLLVVLESQLHDRANDVYPLDGVLLQCSLLLLFILFAAQDLWALLLQLVQFMLMLFPILFVYSQFIIPNCLRDRLIHLVFSFFECLTYPLCNVLLSLSSSVHRLPGGLRGHRESGSALLAPRWLWCIASWMSWMSRWRRVCSLHRLHLRIIL